MSFIFTTSNTEKKLEFQNHSDRFYDKKRKRKVKFEIFYVL